MRDHETLALAATAAFPVPELPVCEPRVMSFNIRDAGIVEGKHFSLKIFIVGVIILQEFYIIIPQDFVDICFRHLQGTVY